MIDSDNTVLSVTVRFLLRVDGRVFTQCTPDELFTGRGGTAFDGAIEQFDLLPVQFQYDLLAVHASLRYEIDISRIHKFVKLLAHHIPFEDFFTMQCTNFIQLTA
jgi:hypothetical protein